MRNIAEIKTVKEIAFMDISKYLRTRYTPSELRYGLIVTPHIMRADNKITNLNKQLGINTINR